MGLMLLKVVTGTAQGGWEPRVAQAAHPRDVGCPSRAVTHPCPYSELGSLCSPSGKKRGL